MGPGNNFQLVRSVLKYRWWFQISENCSFSKAHLIWTSWGKKKLCDDLPLASKHMDGSTQKLRLYARMDQNHHLANKKCLFYAMRDYYLSQNRCVFKDKVFPVTFHLIDGV